jgi:predicted Rossmann fold flavoprotein
LSSSSPHRSALPGVEVAIVGAGAAGLATAIFMRRVNRARSVVVLEGARKPGAKILVSGGSRCNVTNRLVSEADFWGGRRALIRRVLRAFTADDTVRFFRELNVPLHEEADGKLFPDSNRSRDVLNALLRAADDAGAPLLTDHRVLEIRPAGDGFLVTTSRGAISCRYAVLATGGQSLPKTGSNGAGFDFARQLGHTIVQTTPALVPLLLDDVDGTPGHEALSGVSHRVELCVRVEGRITARLPGALLWTHFGISGPAALNASRHWLRANLQGRDVHMTANLCPGESFDSLERSWAAAAAARPRSSIGTVVAAMIPSSVAAALLNRVAVDPSRVLAHLTRAERRTLVHALIECPIAVKGSRGYTYAEATAGGVSLDEVDTATMESRVCAGLFLVGEILDVDGRIGGFNFQWAWSTAYVAGLALAAR